jgi:serine/threonine-protein kinase
MKKEERKCPQCGRKFVAPATQCTVDGSALYGPKAERRIGGRIGNYEVLSIIGVGGMGVVYKGQHAILEKPVAIKVLNDRFAAREGGVDQFLREAKAATRTRHPNIVDVTDFGTEPDGSVYFVMEYLEGISLEDILARDGLIPLFNAVNIVRQIAHGLHAAHLEGIIHRDLKPENIFLVNREGRRRVVRKLEDGSFVVEKEGNFDFVKLLDFGVAKYTMDDVGPSFTTKAGMIFGTPQYMSPEQARGEAVDARSDVYALGVLFYEMITGIVPFDGETALDVLNGHVSGVVIPPSRKNPNVVIDPGTDHTILTCLQKDSDQRYQSMEELIAALVNCFTDQVFLRDAHLMPGATEAGITAPPKPTPIPGAEQASPRGGPPSPAVPSGPGLPVEDSPPPPSRVRSITDELSELFGVASKPSATDLEQALETALSKPEENRAQGREVHPLTEEHAKAKRSETALGHHAISAEIVDDPPRRSRTRTKEGVGQFEEPTEPEDKKRKTRPFTDKE